MSEKVIGSYISYKVGRIRWKPEIMDDSELFITGSTDEEKNVLDMWSYPLNDVDLDNLPIRKSRLSHDGDVTGIEFLSTNVFVSSSGHGTVHLVEYSGSKLIYRNSWERIHRWNTGEVAVCTDVNCFEEDVASVGEDGRIVLLTITQKKPVRSIDNADSCPIQCVCFTKHNELVTGNLRGQLKIWDLRAPEDTPMSTFMQSGDGGICMCIANHPTQRHLMLAGGEDGAITVWDLRKSSYPVNVLNAHSTPVSEMMFHSERPEHLFTCSLGGDLWQWNTSRNLKDLGTEETPWLSSDATKHRMDVLSLMTTASKPIISFDVNRTRLVCGCDNESVYLIKNLSL